jgi:hypothetical protein
MEIWKDIPNYKGRYQVSNTGKVRSLNYLGTKGKIQELKLSVNDHGYKRVHFKVGDQAKTFDVHRLVALAFIGKPNGLQVNHIDGNKLNNHVLNLEYVTASQNTQHAYDMGLVCRTGENNGRSKLTKEDVLKIRELYSLGNFTQKQLGEMFNVAYGTVKKIINRERWSHI